jgi:putative transposase
MWAASYGTRPVKIGGRCIKKSLASASIQERHALIERLREQMPHLTIRKLCRLLGVNRQWYYQHRCSSVHQEYDQRLCAAIQEIREVFAGYGYRRVTKALIRSGWKVNHKRVWRVMR